MSTDIPARTSPKPSEIACEKFEADWIAGRRPRIEDYLTGVAPGDLPGLFRDLLRLEMKYRGNIGERPTLDEYVARFPAQRVLLVLAFANLGKDIDRIVEPPPTICAPVNPHTDDGGELLVSGRRVQYFGDYELLEELARGGMGVVYRARQVSLNRPVALKLILSGQLASPTERQRFRQEAEAAAILDHPNIVSIYEVGEYRDQSYICMKLVEVSKKLEQMTLQSGDLPQRQQDVASLLATVARAVHYAHQHGVIHRDIKPENILIGLEGKPYLTDFGLAKRATEDAGLTQTGAIVGTPSYMAPEQAAGKTSQITTAVDVYSLGAVLFTLLTGRPPFQGGTVFETLQLVLGGELESPRHLNPDIDADLAAICLKCLARMPAQRYASAEGLAEELERWVAGEPLTVRPETAGEVVWRWLRKHTAAALWVVLLGLLLGGLGAFCFGLVTLDALLVYLVRQPSHIAMEDDIPTSIRLYAGFFRLFHVFPVAWRWWFAGFVGLATFANGGLIALALVRPRDGRGDLAVGLGYGLIAGLMAYFLSVGPVVLWAGVVTPQLTSLSSLSTAAFDLNGDAKERTAFLLETNPWFRELPDEQRRGIFFERVTTQMTVGVLVATWIGLLVALVVVGVPPVIQAVWSGSLLRDRGFLGAFLPASELGLIWAVFLGVLFLAEPLYAVHLQVGGGKVGLPYPLRLVATAPLGFVAVASIFAIGSSWSLWRRWALYIACIPVSFVYLFLTFRILAGLNIRLYVENAGEIMGVSVGVAMVCICLHKVSCWPRRHTGTISISRHI